MNSTTKKKRAAEETRHEYRDFVSKMAARKDGDILLTRWDDHAVTVLKAIIGETREKIQLFSVDLGGPVYGSPAVVDAMVHFARSHPWAGGIEILANKEVDANCPLIAALRAGGLMDRVKLWLVPKDRQDYNFSFMVTDGRNYHFFEDRRKDEASASFGSEKGGGNLRKVFESTQAAAEPMPFPALPTAGKAGAPDLHA